MDNKILDFLITAKRNTYAGHGSEVTPFRPDAHDLKYQKDNLLYMDTYLGGKIFHGEEAIWQDNVPLWVMNYSGRVFDSSVFSGDFLKEALYHVPKDMPYRGPKTFIKGDYIYTCKTSGDINWYQGTEEIIYKDKVIYECLFSGGKVEL